MQGYIEIMKTTSIILIAIIGFVCLIQTTNAVQLQQRSVQDLEVAQKVNLAEKSSRKHKSKKQKREEEYDESDEYNGPNNYEEDESPAVLLDNGGNTREMQAIESEVTEQLKEVEMNPFLQAIIANSNKIDLAKDLKDKEAAKDPTVVTPASAGKIWFW